MSTNYYWIGSLPCVTCGHFDKEDMHHIGSASEDKFNLHVSSVDEDCLVSANAILYRKVFFVDDWEKLFQTNNSIIIDEYKKVIQPNEMMEIINSRPINICPHIFS